MPTSGPKTALSAMPKKQKKLAENIPGARVMVVESGHVIGAELADRVNGEILDFLEENEAKDENTTGKKKG